MCNNNEKMAEDMKVTLDVDTYTDDMVMIPRAEYSEMVAECIILRVVEKLAGTTEDLYQNSGSVIRMQGVKQDTVDKLIPIFTKCGMTVVIEQISV